MAPISSAETDSLDTGTRRQLLDLAFEAIRFGLAHGKPMPVRSDDYPVALQRTGAAFVTLQKEGNLRGCIGHLEAFQPLVKDVVENAFAAAFRDSRFPPLSAGELTDLELHISLLTPAEEMTFDSEDDLLNQLRPGVDGLILQEGYRRGTFLPSVWESLPAPGDFLRHLKMKAGLPPTYWSDSIQVSRYRTESFGGSEASEVG